MRVGIDIGGTKAVVALVNDSGEIVSKSRIATGADADSRAVIDRAVGEMRSLLAREGIAETPFVGVGIPGTVDNDAGIVVAAPNLGWYDQPVSRHFREACGVVPVLVQDTRAAAWAESRTEAMREKRCVACVTLGTGIGCGIVLDGRILHGALGTAGEIGHIPVIANGRACNCGRHGCMEAYASGTGIARSAREMGLAQSSEEVFSLAETGDERALAVLDQATTCAAMAISAMINVLSPDALLFSGGMSAQKALYVEPLMRKIREMAYEKALGLYMGEALLGPDAPAIGAARMDEAR